LANAIPRLFLGVAFVRVATTIAQADSTTPVGSAGRLDAVLTYWTSIAIPREETHDQATLAAQIGKPVSLCPGATTEKR